MLKAWRGARRLLLAPTISGGRTALLLALQEWQPGWAEPASCRGRVILAEFPRLNLLEENASFSKSMDTLDKTALSET